MGRRVPLIVLVSMLVPVLLPAQERNAGGHALPSAPEEHAPTGQALTEVLMTSVGSLTGTAMALEITRNWDCEGDYCIPVEAATTVIAASVVGTVGGGALAAKLFDDSPSVLGLTLGAATGVVAGVVVASKVDTPTAPDIVVPLSFSITQGTLATVGDWLLR